MRTDCKAMRQFTLVMVEELNFAVKKSICFPRDCRRSDDEMGLPRLIRDYEGHRSFVLMPLTADSVTKENFSQNVIHVAAPEFFAKIGKVGFDIFGSYAGQFSSKM